MEIHAAIVRDGNVENVIIYDEPADWSLPEGTELVVLSEDEKKEVGLAWTRENKSWKRPPMPELPDIPKPPAPNGP